MLGKPSPDVSLQSSIEVDDMEAPPGSGELTSISISIPDIERFTDQDLAKFANMRDGKWSDQTKFLLNRFGTSRLDLNSGWASTWTFWRCPCCERDKSQIARVSSGGVLLCRLEYHHDHLADIARNVFREQNPYGEDRDRNIQLSRSKDALLIFVERFEPTLICIDCNLAEGQAKLELGVEIEKDFTFSPKEIAKFIEIQANTTHTLDIATARAIWAEAKDEFFDRLDFAKRISSRVAKGRHRREVAHGQRNTGQLQERDVLFKLFHDNAPNGALSGIGSEIELRSVSYDSAGNSPKPKRKPLAKAPSMEEFARIDLERVENRLWSGIDINWTCPCCGRSKFEICRKSKRGKWTAQIHCINNYLEEIDPLNLRNRRLTASNGTVLGSYEHLYICHDCRNITAEAQRRHPGLSCECLTPANLTELVQAPTPHSAHEVDFSQAILMALSNAELVNAIGEFRDHISTALSVLADAKSLRKHGSLSELDAVKIIGCEFAKANNWDLDDGDAYVEWLLSEAARLETLVKGSP